MEKQNIPLCVFPMCVESTLCGLKKKMKLRSLWEKIIKYQKNTASLFYIAVLGYMNFLSCFS